MLSERVQRHLVGPVMRADVGHPVRGERRDRTRSHRGRASVPIALALLALLVTLVTACGGSDDKSVLIAGDDGRATLEIPNDALPDGVSPADVRLRSLPLDQAPSAPGVTAVAAYELLPDGLQLVSPVSLEVQLSLGAPSGTIFSYHVSAGERWELVDIADSEFDPETETVTLTASLSHFSVFNVYLRSGDGPTRSELIGLDPIDVSVAVSASKVTVGDSFELTGTFTSTATPGLTWSQAANVVNRQDGIFEVTVSEAPLMFKGHFTGDGGSPGLPAPVTPTRMNDAPANTALNGAVFTARQTFKCVKAGTALVSYWVDARVPVNGRRELRVRDELVDYLTTGHVAAWKFGTAVVECVAPPTPTPAAGAAAAAFLLSAGLVEVDASYSGGTGGCGYAEGFTDQITISTPGPGLIRIEQPSTGDLNEGEIQIDGSFFAMREDEAESYEGVLDLDGSGIAVNLYTDSAGCTTTYQVSFAIPVPSPTPTPTPSGGGASGDITCISLLGQTTCTDRDGNEVPPPASAP